MPLMNYWKKYWHNNNEGSVFFALRAAKNIQTMQVSCVDIDNIFWDDLFGI